MKSDFLERLAASRERAEPGTDRADVLARFARLCEALDTVLDAPKTPARVRAKAAAFKALLDEAADRLGDAMFQPSYLLNVVGDALVRTDFHFNAVIDFIQVGLYFHGLKQIERRFPAHAAAYAAIHADLIADYVRRDSLVSLVEHGRAKLEQGKVFCLTYHYLNELKKAWYVQRRVSDDALDHVAGGEAVVADLVRSDNAPVDARDRVGMMLDIFANRLTASQQRVYLAKNRSGETNGLIDRLLGSETSAFAKLLRELDRELDGHGNLGWSEIAARLAMNEKTAKREYIRALHTLLSESAKSVFGLGTSNNYVKNVLAQLRAIVYEKDLRIRSSSGDSLGRLVAKWEVALRFVLNHQRIPA